MWNVLPIDTVDGVVMIRWRPSPVFHTTLYMPENPEECADSGPLYSWVTISVKSLELQAKDTQGYDPSEFLSQ